jgi:Tol biopolymer transport system component
MTDEICASGEPVRLTADNREIYGISWTGDGHSLAFSSKRGGRLELWQIPAKRSDKPFRVTAAGDDPREVAISKEGHHLVYSHLISNSNVWRIPLSGSADATPVISSARSDDHSKYSRDGKQIAFESDRSGNPEIWTANVDGSNQVQLTSFRNAWSGSPRWSPDSQKIAFDGNAAGNWDIYVMSAHGGKPQRLTTSTANEYRPSWSHDGRWIYYASTQTGTVQVWKIPSAGGTPVQVTNNGGGVAFESVDGRDLYYAKEDEGLWRLSLQDGSEIQVLKSLHENAFVPARQGIYFVQDSPANDNTSQVKLLDFRTHAIRTLATLAGSAPNEISVSPDEQSLLFDRPGRGSSELMLIENFR